VSTNTGIGFRPGSEFISSSTCQLLQARQLEIAHRIAPWDLKFALDKMVWDGKLSEDECAMAEREFKRFILMIGMDIKPIAMISPTLDEVWHQMVLFTRRYVRFCRETVGFFIHHTPETPENPIPVEAAIRLMVNYERLFGPMPSVWFSGMTAELQRYYEARPFRVKPPVRWSGWTGRDRRVRVGVTEF